MCVCVCVNVAGQIQGNPTAVQTVAEVLSSVVDSTYTKIITVTQPGIARFLLHDDEGLSILGEMTAKFQVYINLEMVHWEPLEEHVLITSTSVHLLIYVYVCMCVCVYPSGSCFFLVES